MSPVAKEADPKRPSPWAGLLPGVDLELLAPVAPTRNCDPHALVRAALLDAGLLDFVREALAAAAPLSLVVNDPHRFSDTRVFVELLVELLDGERLAPRLRLLVAAGTHVSTAAERASHESRILGDLRSRFTEIAWHDARDSSKHVRIGAYSLHYWMGERGFYLACGSMEPHYFAGVTGAHKTLTVGVMSRQSIEANHAHALSAEARGLRLAGNPVHEGVVSALGALEASGAHLLVLNQVIVGGKIIGASAGQPLTALQEGLALVRSCFARQVARPADLVIARVEPPLDRDLYQADKGIKNTEAAVRDGGVLIVEAACRQGIGIDHFLELLRQAPSHARAMEIVASRGYCLGDHKAVRLRALGDLRRVHLGLVSKGIDPGMEKTLGMRVFPGPEQAAAWACSLLGGARAHGLVVEDAGNLTLELR